MTSTLLSLGHGYSARALSHRLLAEGWTVFGTTRSAEKAQALRAEGVTPLAWDKASILPALSQATHLLVSAAPGAQGDPALHLLGPEIAARAPKLHWAGYFSTTGVYGDRKGAWVDETATLAATSPRARARVAAEEAWRAVPGLPIHIFRLAGIYGPGRGPFAKIRAGTAQRVIKPNQFFSRIHVDDIAGVLRASMARPDPGAAYNVCDDIPAPPQDVLACAAEMLGLPTPPDIPFETADMSPMARAFYADSKKVSNRRIREELGVVLRYPDYQSGLAAILEAERA